MGQEEDLGTMARSWGVEMTKEAVVRGDAVVRGRRRDRPARSRFCRCMPFACLFASSTTAFAVAMRVLRKVGTCTSIPDSRNSKKI